MMSDFLVRRGTPGGIVAGVVLRIIRRRSEIHRRYSLHESGQAWQRLCGQVQKICDITVDSQIDISKPVAFEARYGEIYRRGSWLSGFNDAAKRRRPPRQGFC
jgi:hypothetical protein